MFRLAIETGVTGNVERVVFLALRGEEGHAECAWPVPLDVPVEQGKPGVQLRLIEDDGYQGPVRPSVVMPPALQVSRPRKLRAI